MTDQLLIDHSDAVLTITMNRPEKKNALSREMYSGMAEAIRDAQDDSSLRAVIIQGSEECFTSGNDISDFVNVAPGGADSPVYDFLKTICNADKPLIAAVNGPAVGIGTTMLLHCDLVYVADDAMLTMPFVNLGLFPEAASSFLLPRLIGHLRAAEMLLLGQAITGQRAAEMGLANYVFGTGADVLDAARTAALRIADQPPGSVRLTKQLLKQGVRETACEIMDKEGEHFASLLQGPEAREALSAFIEKRKPTFPVA